MNYLKFIIIAFAVLFSSIITHGQEKPEGLFINSKAPEIKAKDQNGNDFKLKDALKNGTIVLIFYRGNWCPYCNKQLKKLEDSLQFIKDKGAQLIAVTPEMQDGINKTIEKTKASYTILHDKDNKIMKAYGVASVVDERTVSRYKNADIDLATINGQKEIVLPVPAVYIINKEGTIDYRFFESDYKKRPSVREILDNLK